MTSPAGLTLLLPLVAIAGCVVVPVPERHTLAGRRITSEDTAFIQPGVTTRHEVLQVLGQPTMDFQDRRIFAYSWEMLSAYMPWVVAAGYSAAGGIEKVGRPYVLLVAFDENDRVLRFDTKERWPLDTIQEHAAKWAEHQGLNVSDRSTQFRGTEIPARRSVIYIYRPGGWDDAPTIVPSVTIDGQLVAQLRKGRYVAVILSPNSHSVFVNPDPNPTTFLKSEERPIRSFSFDALPDTAYYVEVKIHWGFGALDPVLTIRPREQAQPDMKKLQSVW